MAHETSYRVTLETRDGRRILDASNEREVALKAESVMRRYAGSFMTIGFCVDCADAGARQRIAFYLTDLALELEMA